MNRSSQTSQWDNISKRVKRYEAKIDTIDFQIAKAFDELNELQTWLDNEYEDKRELSAKVIYYMQISDSARERLARLQVSEVARNISHMHTSIYETKKYIQNSEELKAAILLKRDEVLTAYADPKHNEQFDIWPKDDDMQYETIYLPNGDTKTRLRQPVYLPSGEVADFMDDFNRRHHGYPHPIGPLTNEQTQGQYFDNEGNLVLDLNPNPTNQVPYTVDWI